MGRTVFEPHCGQGGLLLDSSRFIFTPPVFVDLFEGRLRLTELPFTISIAGQTLVQKRVQLGWDRITRCTQRAVTVQYFSRCHIGSPSFRHSRS